MNLATVFGQTINRLRWLLLLMGLVLTSSLTPAGESVQVAVLMPAPNVPPVKAIPRSSPADASEELHPARRALERNPIYDENNPDYYRLQRIDEATRHLKHDTLGFPDWMAAIRSGDITPRAGLSPDAKMNVLDLNVIMKNTKEMPYVRFPHESHTLWLACSNCHPAPFLPQAGANPVSMSQIFRGKYCGMCHDRVAFITFFSCSRCHSVPQGAATPQP